jgi:hypothetical protein
VDRLPIGTPEPFPPAMAHRPGRVPLTQPLILNSAREVLKEHWRAAVSLQCPAALRSKDRIDSRTSRG